MLVIDTSGSMKFCAECGQEIDDRYDHNMECRYYGQWNYQSRMEAAEEASNEFLRTYSGRFTGGTETGTQDLNLGRYLAIVSFATTVGTSTQWYDVSNKTGYNAAQRAINNLGADGGTNLERGLNAANGKLTDSAVQNIAAEHKNVIALTDGEPTFYGEEEWQGLLDGYLPNGGGSYCDEDTYNATIATATALKQKAKLYTVCFGVANELMKKDYEEPFLGFGGGYVYWDFTVGEFLSKSIATQGCAHNADNTEQLYTAFTAISSSITTGLDGTGLTVTDPMGAGITATLPADGSVTDDGSAFTWDLSEATPSTRTVGTTTYYTYTYTYTIELDTSAEGFDENAYHPANARTTLTIPGDTPTVLDFPVPAVKGTAPRYTVTYACGDRGTLAGQDASGNVSTSNLKKGDATPAAPAVTADDGFYFAGWSPSVSPTVQGNAVYTAQYAPQGAIKLTGATDTKTYNGSVQSLTSYSTEGLPSGYTLSGVTYLAAGTDVDSYNGSFSGTPVICDASGTDVTYKYAVSLHPGKLSITQQEIQITADSASKVYDTTALTKATYQITSGSLVDGHRIWSIKIEGSQTEVGVSSNTPSEAVIVDASGTPVTGNYKISYVPGTLTVTKDTGATLTAKAYSGVYDGASHNGIVSVELKNGKGETISTDGWTFTYTYDGTAYTSIPQFKNAGSYPIVVSAVNSNYGTVTAESVIAKINPKPVTMTSDTDSKTYDGQPLKAEHVTDSGFVAGEGVAEYKNFASITDKGSIPNTFEYTLKSNTLASNYQISKSYGTLTVNPITDVIIITAKSDKKTYDGKALTNDGYTYTQGILISGDTLTAVVSGSQTNAGSSDNRVTSYKVMRGSVDVTANYTFGASVPGTLTVEKRAVTMVSPDASKAFDGNPLTTAASEVAVNGFISGEGVTITMTGSQTIAGTSSNTFTYVANSGTLLTNYIITPTYGTLLVTKSSTAQMTAQGYSGMYDGASHSITVTPVEGSFVAGTVWSYEYSVDGGAYSTTKPSYTDVCSHTVTVKASNANYQDVICSATVTITKRDVTLTSGSASRPYNGNPLTAETVTPSGSGFVTGEGAVYSEFASLNEIKKIDNTFSYTLKDNTKAGNYDISVVYGTLEITPYTTALTITAKSDSKVYDGLALTNNGYEANSEKLVSGDVLSVTVTGSQTDVGSSDNVVTVVKITRNGVDVTANYSNITTVNGTLTVTKRPLTLESASATKPYDGTPLTNSTVTVTSGRWASGEGADFDVTGSQLDMNSSPNYFTYTAKDGTKLSNYEITKKEGTLTVTKALGKIVVTADSASRKYDGTALTDTGYTVSGTLVSGEVLTAVTKGSVTDADTVSNVIESFTIKRGDTDVTGNYNVETKPGTLTVTPRSVTLTSATDSKIYDTKPLTNSKVEISGDGFVDGEGVTCNITGSQTSAGSSPNTFDEKTPYTFNAGTKSQNYSIECKEGTLTVMAVQDAVIVVIKGNTGSVRYDTKEHSVEGYEIVSISDPLYTKNDFTFSGTASAKGTEVGEYPMGLKAEDFTNNNKNFENVVFQVEDGGLTIFSKELTVKKTVNLKVATPGTRLRYTITIKNDGRQDMEHIALKDVLKAGDTEIAYLEVYTAAGDKITEIELLKAGEEIKLYAEYKVNSWDVGKTLVNTIDARDADGDGGTASSEETRIEAPYVPPFRPSKPEPEETVPIEILNTEEHFNYLIGYEDGTVHPDGNLTRAEASTIFFRLLTDEARAQYLTEQNAFSDVNRGQWFNTAISTLSAIGIVRGYDDGTFRPNEKITRAELAAIISRFAELDGTSAPSFSDIEGHWAQDSIRLAASNGWIYGYTDGSFRPNQAITRAETAAMINRVLDRTPKNEDALLDGMITFWDNLDTTKWYYIPIQEATNYHRYVKDESGETWVELLTNIDWTVYEQ